MVRFLKENGFPMTLILDTDFEFIDEDGQKCHKTKMLDENNKILSEFEHKDLRARVHWANGFFTALRMINNEPEVKYIVYEYTENASEQYQGTRFMTVYTGEITGNADPEELPLGRRLKVVAKDITESEAYALVNQTTNKNADAYLNSLPKELRSTAGDEFIRNMIREDNDKR